MNWFGCRLVNLGNHQTLICQLTLKLILKIQPFFIWQSNMHFLVPSCTHYVGKHLATPANILGYDNIFIVWSRVCTKTLVDIKVYKKTILNSMSTDLPLTQLFTRLSIKGFNDSSLEESQVNLRNMSHPCGKYAVNSAKNLQSNWYSSIPE